MSPKKSSIRLDGKIQATRITKEVEYKLRLLWDQERSKATLMHLPAPTWGEIVDRVLRKGLCSADQ